MIKINLLPVRADKRKETVKRQVVISALLIVLVLVAFMFVYLLLIYKVSSTKNDIAKAEARIAELKIKIGKINNLEKLKADVQKKLDILNRLRKEKTGPVQRLQILSENAPDKLWVTKYVESGSGATVNGVAFEEELIANFIKSLDSSTAFSNVDLVVTEQIEMGGLKVKKFELKMNLRSAISSDSSTPKLAQPKQTSSASTTSTGSPAPSPLTKKDAVR